MPEMKENSETRKSVERVLEAFMFYRLDVGYVQGNFIV